MMGGACRIIPVDGSVVNNQSDRKSPVLGIVGPFSNGHKKCLINWGDPNYIQWGPILHGEI